MRCLVENHHKYITHEEHKVKCILFGGPSLSCASVEPLGSIGIGIGCHNSVILNCELLHQLYFILIYLRTSFLPGANPGSTGVSPAFCCCPLFGRWQTKKGQGRPPPRLPQLIINPLDHHTRLLHTMLCHPVAFNLGFLKRFNLNSPQHQIYNLI